MVCVAELAVLVVCEVVQVGYAHWNDDVHGDRVDKSGVDLAPESGRPACSSATTSSLGLPSRETIGPVGFERRRGAAIVAAEASPNAIAQTNANPIQPSRGGSRKSPKTRPYASRKSAIKRRTRLSSCRHARPRDRKFGGDESRIRSVHSAEARASSQALGRFSRSASPIRGRVAIGPALPFVVRQRTHPR